MIFRKPVRRKRKKCSRSLINLSQTINCLKEQRYLTKSSTLITVDFYLQITRVTEGIETAIFKQFFASWNESENENFGFGRFSILRQ